eukprot:1155767-Pelagomonas_calceolata.AAC.2
MDAFVGNQVAAGADVRMGVFGERRKCRGWPGGDWEPFSRPVVPVGAISDRTDAAAEVVVPTLLSKTLQKIRARVFEEEHATFVSRQGYWLTVATSKSQILNILCLWPCIRPGEKPFVTCPRKVEGIWGLIAPRQAKLIQSGDQKKASLVHEAQAAHQFGNLQVQFQAFALAKLPLQADAAMQSFFPSRRSMSKAA